MIKYRTWYDTRIEEVEVIRETAKFVTESDGQRWAKRNDDFRNYFDTYQQAKDFLIDRVSELKKLEGRLEAIKARQNETRSPNHALLERLEIERDILNAVPDMRSILGEIRRGDSDMIRFVIGQIETAILNAKMPPEMVKYLTLLRRYQAIASKMEAERK